ncbi:unnamed protein product [Bemisia tabaci]|uniref:Uncharacterized protein n=1 Tax=Bemisia tabaci TaxID=7038 RepID=A0A9P0CHW0_BEMTA|nr:unnamed protein product [Bemisia tabaci]
MIDSVFFFSEDDDDDDRPDSEEDGTYAHETPGTGPDSGFVRHSTTRMDPAVPGKMFDEINEMMNLSRPKSPSRAPNSSRNVRIKSFDDEGDDEPHIATPVRMVKGIQSPSRNVRTSTWGGEGDAGPYRNPHGGRNMKSYGGDGDLGFATPKYQGQMSVMSGHGGPFNGFNRVPYSPNNGWAMSGFDRSPYGFNGGFNGYNGFNGGYGGFNGFNRNNFMNNALRAVQDFVESPSAFTPTIECPAKIGKYVCKIQCRMKDETLRGVCFHDSCFCAPQERKEALKHMSRSYRALVSGYDTICDNWKNLKQCMRFCKALTPNKSYTGICKDDHCQCVTNPSIPEAKKYACMKAIRKVKKMEDTALKYLGFRPLPLSQLSAAAEKKVNEVADATLRELKSSNKIDGCTEEDIKNLRSILAGLAQGLSLARGHGGAQTPTPSSNGSQESKPGAPSSAPRRFEPGSPGPRVKGT